MAKGEGAESGSAAGLLPTGILQASDRPVQVKVRSREEDKGWWAGREVGTGASAIRPGLGTLEGSRVQRGLEKKKVQGVLRDLGVMEKVCSPFAHPYTGFAPRAVPATLHGVGLSPAL